MVINSGSTYARLPREWRFQENNGDVGNVTIAYADSSLPTGFTGSIYAIFDDDGDFTSGTQTVLTGTLATGIWSFTSNVSTTQPFMTLAYKAPNFPPTAVNDTATGSEDLPLTINVSANDTDTADFISDIVTISGATITSPTNGTVVLSGTTQIVYTPNANWCGTDSFTYRAYDGVNTST